MALRIIQVVVEHNISKLLEETIQHLELIDWWQHIDENQKVTFSLLTSIEKTQLIIDALQTVVNFDKEGRIVILNAEATLPKPIVKEPSKKEAEEKPAIAAGGLSREELYGHITDGIVFDRNFILLVILSAIVASIGMLEDNHAVLIGAMVIAPLLGPNLAIAFATAIGDLKLMLNALLTNFVGCFVALLCSTVVGFLWQFNFTSPTLLRLTDVGYGGIVVALASGAAAVLSLTTGLSSVLVGVMVAVALLPPICAAGIMIGAGNYILALGALLLFAVNFVSISLAANIIFSFKGIRPHRWYEKQKAKKAAFWQAIFLAIALLILIIGIYFKHGRHIFG